MVLGYFPGTNGVAVEQISLRKDSRRDVHGWLYSWVRFRLPWIIQASSWVLSSLGDRHLENILMDVSSGDAIHVDFNCLFEKVSYIKLFVRFALD